MTLIRANQAAYVLVRKFRADHRSRVAIGVTCMRWTIRECRGLNQRRKSSSPKYSFQYAMRPGRSFVSPNWQAQYLDSGDRRIDEKRKATASHGAVSTTMLPIRCRCNAAVSFSKESDVIMRCPAEGLPIRPFPLRIGGCPRKSPAGNAGTRGVCQGSAAFRSIPLPRPAS